MRIAILQSETRFVGGVERVTEGILRHDGWHDMEWHAIFLRPGVLADRVADFFPRDRMAVLDAGHFRNVPRTILTVARIAHQLRRWKIDAVLSQGFHAQCYGGLAARLAGARDVFWCHELLPNHSQHVSPTMRLAMRMPVDAVVGGPKSNLANLERAFGGRCPVRLMYPAYPLSHVSRGDRLRVRREFNIHDNAPLAVVIGRLERGKGQHVFLRAAAHVLQHLPETRFMIVGGAANHANRHFEAELKQQARDLVIADRVIFTGERHDIADILAAADVVVVPSTAPESFGLVVVESMAAGRAVIATNHGGPAEIIRHGEDGLLVRPDDDAALGRAMLRVFHNEALRLCLEHNAPARVATFSFGKMAERLTAVLQDVLACPDPIGIPAIGGRAQ